MATNGNSNNSRNFGGAFSFNANGLQSLLGKRVSATLAAIENEPIVALPLDKSFPAVTAHASVEGEDVSETGDVEFNGVDIITLYRNEDGLGKDGKGLIWGIKYANPIATRNADGKNTQATTIVANAWKSESRTKDLLSALSLIRRGVFTSVSAAMIEEPGKIVVNLQDPSVKVVPIVIGGSTAKPIIQRGAATLHVGDRKISIAYNTTIDFSVIKDTDGRWFEFQRTGRIYRHSGNVTGDQETIYEFVLEILASGCDVFLKGLAMHSRKPIGNPAALLAREDLRPYFNAKLMRFYPFAMYVDKLVASLNASTQEEAIAIHDENVKEANIAALNKSTVRGLVQGSVAGTKNGEVRLASDLFNLPVVLDGAWLASEGGQSVVKMIGKKAIVVDGDKTMLDLAKIKGTIFIGAVNAETHQLVRGINSLKISTSGIKGEGKNATLDTETPEGKQNLKALAVLTGEFKSPLAWKVLSFSAETK